MTAIILTVFPYPDNRGLNRQRPCSNHRQQIIRRFPGVFFKKTPALEELPFSNTDA
jgi:hypothetical protein